MVKIVHTSLLHKKLRAIIVLLPASQLPWWCYIENERTIWVLNGLAQHCDETLRSDCERRPEFIHKILIERPPEWLSPFAIGEDNRSKISFTTSSLSSCPQNILKLKHRSQNAQTFRVWYCSWMNYGTPLFQKIKHVCKVPTLRTCHLVEHPWLWSSNFASPYECRTSAVPVPYQCSTSAVPVPLE